MDIYHYLYDSKQYINNTFITIGITFILKNNDW
jgi:hypothetical protein